MEKCVTVLLLSVLLLKACSNNVSPDKPSGSLLLGFQSNLSPIIYLSLSVKSINFINQDNEATTISINKNLDLSIYQRQYLGFFKLPVADYYKAQLHISMQNSVLVLFDLLTREWTPVRMLTMNSNRIPQDQSEFFVEIDFNDPIKITPEKIQLYQLATNPSDALTLDMTNAEVIRFTPEFRLKSTSQALVTGRLGLSPQQGYLSIKLNHATLELPFDQFRLNHVLQPNEAIMDLEGAYFEASLSKNSQGQLFIIDNSLTVITRERYTGWLIKSDDDFSLIGQQHKATSTSFIHTDPLASADHVLSVFSNNNQKIDTDQLHAGQYATIYKNERGITVYLEPVTIDGMLTTLDEHLVINPLTIDGKPYDLFNGSPLTIPTHLKTAFADGQKVRLFSDLTENNLRLLQPAPLIKPKQKEKATLNINTLAAFDEKQVSVDIDFSVHHDALLFHEAVDSDTHRFYFADKLDNTRITASLSDTAITSPISISAFLTSSETICDLTYFHDGFQRQMQIKGFSQLIKQVSQQLNNNEYKLLSLKASGVLDNNHLITHSLSLSLQTPFFYKQAIFMANKDRVTDADQLHPIQKNKLSKSETPIAAITGVALAGLVALASYTTLKSRKPDTSNSNENTAMVDQFDFLKSGGDEALKIITFNVQMRPVIDHSEIRAKPIADALKQSGADVIAIQELFSQGGKRELTQELMDSYIPIEGPVASANTYVSSGLMFFIKKDIQLLRKETLPFDNGFSADEWANKGGVYINIEKQGKNYHLINTHLQADIEGQEERSRSVKKAQLEKLGTWTETLVYNENPDSEIIYMGDLNIPVEEYDTMIKRTLHTQAPSISGDLIATQGFENTFHKRGKDEPELWLDYVISTKNSINLKTIDMQTNQSLKSWIPGRGIQWKLNPAHLIKSSTTSQLLDLSDHRAVMAKVRR